jgi:Carbohydrate binding domain
MKRKIAALCILVVALGLVAVAQEGKNLLKPASKEGSWRMEQHEAGKGTMKVEDDAIVFDVTETDGTEWHVQAAQAGLDLKDGKEYVLTFKAKAEPDRQLPVNAMIDEDDWHQIGLSENADLTKEWKEFKYEFKAEQTNAAKKNRVTLVLGGDKGKVWVKDVSLMEKESK